jgi:hypothetical protein
VESGGTSGSAVTTGRGALPAAFAKHLNIAQLGASPLRLGHGPAEPPSATGALSLYANGCRVRARVLAPCRLLPVEVFWLCEEGFSVSVCGGSHSLSFAARRSVGKVVVCAWRVFAPHRSLPADARCFCEEGGRGRVRRVLTPVVSSPCLPQLRSAPLDPRGGGGPSQSLPHTVPALSSLMTFVRELGDPSRVGTPHEFALEGIRELLPTLGTLASRRRVHVRIVCVELLEHVLFSECDNVGA